MFKARTSRTILTILGMGIGIGAILFLVSLGYGLQRTILERITTSDSLVTLDVSPKPDSPKKLDKNSAEGIREQKGVAEISPALNYKARVKTGDISSDLNAVITTPPYLRLSGIKIVEGKDLDDNDNQGIVISSSVSRSFGKTPEEMMGTEMHFIFTVTKDRDQFFQASDTNQTNEDTTFESDKVFKVIGVVTEGTDNIYVNYNSLSQTDLGSKEFSTLKVKCQSDKNMAAVRTTLTDSGYAVSSISETVDQLNKVFNAIKIILMLFGIIALLVSAIGMFNTMTIALLERTEEIGIMKSIGASDMTIYIIFVMESTIMGFLGGIFGIVIGSIEGAIFNTLVNLIATHFGGEKVSLFYSPLWFVLTILAFSAFVGFTTGVIPARRAAKTDPLEALRYK